MTTWMDVMSAVRELDAKRRSGRALEGPDAERLVVMLLSFHNQAVARTPSGEHPIEIPNTAPGRSGR